MAKWDRYRDRFAKLRQLWDEAEGIIKQAEQTCEKVCLPAIKELRYAGRRFVEIANLIETDGPDKEIDRLIADAEFNCMRARHDAIDAAVSKIAIDLRSATRSIGYDAILKIHPTFISVTKLIVDARAQIATSRKDRDNRAAIYATVEKVEVPQILAFYAAFVASEPIMVDMAKRERWERLLNRIFGLAGVIALIYTIWDHHK